jgi:hypothetical protein
MDFKETEFPGGSIIFPVDDTIIVANNAILIIGADRSEVGPTMKLEDMDEDDLHRVFMSFKSESGSIISVIEFAELNKAEFRFQDKVQMLIGIREGK